MTITSLGAVYGPEPAVDRCTKCQQLIASNAQWHADEPYCTICALYMTTEGYRLHGSRIQGRFFDAAGRALPGPPWLWEEFPVAAGGRNFRADFILICGPDLKIAIELDSFTHHASRDALTRDHQRQRLFQREGWVVIRFSGSEVWRDPDACVAELIALILLEARRRWGTGLATAA